MPSSDSQEESSHRRVREWQREHVGQTQLGTVSWGGHVAASRVRWRGGGSMGDVEAEGVRSQSFCRSGYEFGLCFKSDGARCVSMPIIPALWAAEAGGLQV